MRSLHPRYRRFPFRPFSGSGGPAAEFAPSNCLIRILFLFLVLTIRFPTHAQAPYWQQELHYTIDVTLHDTDNSLDGFIRILYINHSPDTLRFIWFHIWPNAYKNDQTAFSDQLLENGRIDFYFSDKEQRGYMNRLDFRVDGVVARTIDHPQYIDILKVELPTPLAPGSSARITTPFHEQLPYSFSRGGHIDQSYQITQWYPKPAVYDAQGWHPIPYLDQGEFYGEFGTYEVRISLPRNYVVAGTGELQDSTEIQWLRQRKEVPDYKVYAKSGNRMGLEKKSKTGSQTGKTINPGQPPSDPEIKTIVYKQDQVHDFAWFADKRFLVDQDTLLLPSGRIIQAFSFYLPEWHSGWKNSILFIKNAIRYYSKNVGEYPYQTISAVGTPTGFEGGMEYPTITAISLPGNESGLEPTILHEVGHNWFYGILGSNERRYPWMDEGINTYYEKRYKKELHSQKQPGIANWIQKKLPEDPEGLYIQSLEKTKLDQPISTSSELFTETNYDLLAYQKASQWMSKLEDSLGRSVLDSCMQAYFNQWKFRHPYPADLKRVMEQVSGKSLDHTFSLLNRKGPLSAPAGKARIKPTFLFSMKDPDKFHYINFLPAIGYNLYDQFMIGALIHNFNLPPRPFQFLLAPVYATGSRQWNGLGLASYSWYPDRHFQKISIGIAGSRFSSLSGTDSSGQEIFGGFYKIVPSLRLTFRNKTARSHMEKWLGFKTFLIGEKGFDYVLKSSDNTYYPTAQHYSFRYLNQLTFHLEDYRVLYPYSVHFEAQQSSDFYRIQAIGNYFFNYAKGGGFSMRVFAAKFGYLGEKTALKTFETENFQPKLTAVRGNEDYTYSNYFIGRNETSGFTSQQVMMRDGGLKLRTDLFQGLQGRSDNWVASMNLNTTLPNHLFPVQLPIKIFLDLGTYADAWGNSPPTSRFLYVGGFQVSLLKDILNIYVPIFYSSDFSNSLKTVPEENTFWKKISFSLDIQQFDLKKIFKKIPQP